MKSLDLLAAGILAAALLFTGIAAAEIRQGRPYSLSAAERAVVQRDVSASLKDPESARFGDFGASISAEGVVTVCGWVNARNSFGGYVGMRPFQGVLIGERRERLYVIDIAGTESAAYAVLTVCNRIGVPMQ